tara:strand:+ start:1160 stop:1486 length:327 start_codon:yes stop_codon:yes gene_type:complete
MPEESNLEKAYKEATEPTKFTEEEMKTVKELKNSYGTIQGQFGQAAVAKIRLEEEIGSLNDYVGKLREDFITTQKKEQDFLDAIKEKYGDGELNPETGIFTPFEEEKK